MPLAREIKILRYIYWRREVTGKQLIKKFPDIDFYYLRLKPHYISEDKAEDVYQESVRIKKRISDDEPIISLTIYGDDVVAKHRHEFWAFILPYGITTFIALTSASQTLYKIIKFILNLF